MSVDTEMLVLFLKFSLVSHWLWLSSMSKHIPLEKQEVRSPGGLVLADIPA